LLLAFFLCFAGSGVPHSRQGREEKEKAGQIRPFPASAVARWNTRRHCSSTVAAIPEVVPLQFLKF
jgi:hypothetical protein